MLPKALEILLDTYTESLDLRSWQCYSEGDGVCLKIRFKPSSHIESKEQPVTVKHQQSGKWKKASPSQLKRDSERIEKHRMQTRSQTVDTIEMPREEDTVVDSRLNVSVVSLKSDCTSGSDCNMQMDSSLVRSDSECRPAFKTEFSEASSTEHSPGDYILSPLPPVPEKEDTSDSDEDVVPYVDCPSKRCCYGNSAGDPDIPLFKCTKCSGRFDLLVCAVCHEEGGHSNHQKYIVPYCDT